MVIGVTGSSGAGKSTACKILNEKYNVKIITADEVARGLSKQGTAYLKDIVEQFGEKVLLENGELDRRKLANIIYLDSYKRESLNKCTFKYIVEEIKKEISKSNKELIAIDAPLLFEAALDEICDTTIAVISEDREIQINRIIERDNIDREHALARLSAQHSNEFYSDKCEYTLINNDSLEEQIEEIVSKITKNT